MGTVTIWIPVEIWPVISLTIVDERSDRIAWALVHESFERQNEGERRLLTIDITKVSMPPKLGSSKNCRSVASKEIVLTYGVVPEGLRQSSPGDGAPPPLREHVPYVVVVREGVTSDFRWFRFEVIPFSQ